MEVGNRSQSNLFLLLLLLPGLSPGLSSAITGLNLVSSLSYAGAYTTSAQVSGKVYAFDNLLSPSIGAGVDANLQIATAVAVTAFDIVDLLGGSITVDTTLTAGTYKWNTPLNIAAGATLTINGACGQNFLLISTGAITTGLNSHIVLTGGISPASIVWVGLSFNIAASTSFSGVILSVGNVILGPNSQLTGTYIFHYSNR